MAASDFMTSIGPFIAWTFLPNFISTTLLKFLYRNRILTLPTTQLQAEVHSKRTRTLVILLYLLYTVYASLFNREDNFYELLRVSSLNSDTDTIRRSFRKLAMVHHPDKVGGGPKSERLFINLRRGHDCLVEPVKRMAYDRFGDVVLLWTDAFTARDFFQRGLQSNLTFYIVNPLVFGIIRWFSSERMMDYWQFSMLLLMLSLELFLIVSPSATGLLVFFPRQTTQYDLIMALHTTYIALTLASQHLSPLLPSTPSQSDGTGAGWRSQSFEKSINEMRKDLEMVRQGLREVDNGCRTLRNESERAFSFRCVQYLAFSYAGVHPATTPLLNIPPVPPSRFASNSLLPLAPNEGAAPAAAATGTDQVTEGGKEDSARPQNLPTAHSPLTRKLTPSEETYLHLLARRIYRPGLNAKLALQPSSSSVDPIVPDASSTVVGGEEEKDESENSDDPPKPPEQSV